MAPPPTVHRALLECSVPNMIKRSALPPTGNADSRQVVRMAESSQAGGKFTQECPSRAATKPAASRADLWLRVRGERRRAFLGIARLGRT